MKLPELQKNNAACYKVSTTIPHVTVQGRNCRMGGRDKPNAMFRFVKQNILPSLFSKHVLYRKYLKNTYSLGNNRFFYQTNAPTHRVKPSPVCKRVKRFPFTHTRISRTIFNLHKTACYRDSSLHVGNRSSSLVGNPV